MESKHQDNSDDGGASLWQTGVFDAHCHPTDTMHLVDKIPTMNATALTIMATRAQDQELVVKVAKQHALKPEDIKASSNMANWRGVVPSFGWHPWFSHQIFDDISLNPGASSTLDDDAKTAHYQSVLTPSPQDKQFLLRLPNPLPLSQFLAETKRRLEEFPLALIGEVGLDKSFRIPDAWLPGQEAQSKYEEGLTPGGREGRKLSPFRVDMAHQKKILTAQLRLAGEMGRAASVHGVQAHGVVYETFVSLWKGHEREVQSKRDKKRRGSVGNAHVLEPPSASEVVDSKKSKPFPPRICLHSYSGPAETLKQYLHASVPVDIFFSFSTAINFSEAAEAKTAQVIKALPDERILVESDLHTAGERMDAALENVVRRVCEVKEWELNDGTERLAANWKRFVFGNTVEIEGVAK